MYKSTPPRFFISIMTAIIVGVGTAYIAIAGIQLIANPRLLAQGLSALDTKSIDYLSRVVTYSSEDVDGEADIKSVFGDTIYSTTDKTESRISALSYSVRSLDKGNIILEKNADRLLPIASITKLVTAVVAMKNLDENDMVEITTKALSVEGSSGRFRRGEKFKVEEILYPLLMVSSNDAAEALAQKYDSIHGRGKFVKEMNAWVNSIGAYRTYFRDPSGLSADNVSTAIDLSIISQWIKDNMPEIFNITKTKSKSVRLHTWINPTHFLNTSSYIGGKNGYTTEAKLTSVSLFSTGVPERLYSVVLLGSNHRDSDVMSVLNEALK